MAGGDATQRITVSTAAFGPHPLERFSRDLEHLSVRHVEICCILNYPGLPSDAFDRNHSSRVANQLAGCDLSCTSAVTQLPVEAPAMAIGPLTSLFAQRLDFCAAIGAPHMVINAPPADAIHRFLDALDKARSMTGLFDPIVLFENPGHGPATFLDVAESLILDALDAVRAGLNFDICNYATQGGELLELSAYLAPFRGRIRQVHVKDMRKSGGDLEYCAIGSGEIPVLQALAEPDVSNLPIVAELPLFLNRPLGGPPAPKVPPTVSEIRQTLVHSIVELRRAIPREHLHDVRNG